MKRVTTTLVCLLLVSVLMLPTAAFATEAKTTSAAKESAVETAVTNMLTYPAPLPEATAEEALATTPWQKSGDVLNLVIALGSLVAVCGIIVWGIWATRRASAAA